MHRKDTAVYIENASIAVIAVTLFLLPLVFLTNTTDFFILPKQLLIIGSSLILLSLWALKILFERKIVINNNPLNLTVFLFGLIITISSLLSLNRFDSLIQTVPALFAIVLFYVIVNNVKDKKGFYVVLSSLVLGAAVSAVISVSYYFKIYLLPISGINNQFFTTFGSTVQQAIFLLPIFVFCLFYIISKLGLPKLKLSSSIKNDYSFFLLLIAAIVVGLGLGLIAYQVIALPNKPVILPYIYGFQTAFASISQDAQRFIVSLLFGSGYGTFLVDFTRFKIAGFNLEQSIWNLSFSFSSSYFLELIATSGLLGALSFLGIVVQLIRSRVSKNPLFAAVIVTFILSFLLPFSFINVALFFVLLAIYVSYLNVAQDKRVYDVVLSLVMTKKGMFSFEATPEDEVKRNKESIILPGVILLLVVLIVGFFGFYTYKFTLSDLKFTESLRQASLNNGQATYQLQNEAIGEFPYRSDYYRIFSQVNLALANSLSNSVPEGKQPSQELQQNIVALLQQAINSGRNAVIISPQTSLNWQNLAQIYRNLIGVGENAEQFSIASQNQAIALDPYNPQLYIQLGGIYYQLKNWDQAQNQFQIAINLKRDFANAYYNLGHTLEEKGDLENALAAYQIVKQLSQGNNDNLKAINAEISALEEKIGDKKTTTGDEIQPETEQTPLTLEGEGSNIPASKNPIKISPPPTDEEASASGSNN